MKPLIFSQKTLVTALGKGLQANRDALLAQQSALRPCVFSGTVFDTYVGQIDGLDTLQFEPTLGPYDCRNNRLALLALQQNNFLPAVEAAAKKYGAHRIAVIIGTTTSGMLEGEQAYQQRDTEHAPLPDDYNYSTTSHSASISEYVQQYLKLTGPCYTIGTACSSSAMVFTSAQQLIQAGICDAAVVGGVDTLCFTTLRGFSSLEIVSSQPCRPCDQDRDGLSLGEGAGFILLEAASARSTTHIGLLGYGESNDAYHVSRPHPQGEGAIIAMRHALQQSGLQAEQIDYINMHGTASEANDRAEDQAMARVFGTNTPCSSTKGWTGHTLGASGIIEAILVSICLEEQLLPACLNCNNIDPHFSSQVLRHNQKAKMTYAMSNSFGFGGSNCSLIIGEIDHAT